MGLKDAIKRAGAVVAPQCSQKTKECTKCSNKGYSLHAPAAVVKAELCDCIETCLACFGTCLLDGPQGTMPCMTPTPKKIAALMNQCELPARYLDATVSNFHNFSGNGSTVIHNVKTWLNDFDPQKSSGLILSGGVGVGKTFLLGGIAKYFCQKGLSTRFVDFHQLLAVIKNAYSDNKSEEKILKPLINCDVLVIDELGKGRNNDWEQEKLDQLVMGRYNQNKVIVASTNYKLNNTKTLANVFEGGKDGQFNPDVFEGLEARIGKRIYSRIFETSLLLEITGSDFRRRDGCTVS